MRTVKAIMFVVIAAVGLMCRFVWPLDVASARKITLDSFRTQDASRVEIVQVWNGDGYLTKLDHEEPDGSRWDIVINPDGRKSWKGRLTQTTNSSVLLVKVWGDSFYYNWATKTFTDRNGKVKQAFLLGKP
jgi:hypothetical protein